MPYIDFLPVGGGGGGGGSEYDISSSVVTLVSSSFVYDGTEKTQAISSVVYNGTTLVEGTDYVIMTGSNKATNAGTHTISIAGIINYSGVKNVDWTIAKASVTQPTVSVGTYTYNGTSQGPTITGFDSGSMNKSGDTATNAGSYTLSITLKDANNYQWASGSDISQAWGIGKASLTQPTVSVGSYTYNGTSQGPNVSGYDAVTMIMTGDTAVNAGSYTLTVSVRDTVNYQWSSGSDVSQAWSISKAQGSISASPNSVSIGSVGSSETSTLTVVGNGTVSAASSAPAVISVSLSGSTVTMTAVDSGSATITVTLAEGTNYLGASCTISAEVSSLHIYGVLWDKTSSTALSRTDDAALFSDPVPAISGGTGSSPFDNLMPWSGMVKETIGDDVFVKIPKFWYKWTDDSNGLKLQIADGETEGFHVSPAHADRGDSKGERDYVYIGRYHCDTDYKSKTGVKPKTKINRANARTGCTGRGTGYYQLDYAMWWTICMLYLVEFADWNSQVKIGYGCGDGSATHNSGYSDTMQYHTGTMQTNRTTYGVGVQYRNIEDPWGNVYDWCDGIYLSSSAPYVTNDMSKYGDSLTGHTNVGSSPSGSGHCIKAWTVPTASGLEWALFASEKVIDSNYATYVADYVRVDNNCVFVGGYYISKAAGMFFLGSSSKSTYYDNIGARLQYLP